jgi:hypothetical protein
MTCPFSPPLGHTGQRAAGEAAKDAAGASGAGIPTSTKASDEDTVVLVGPNNSPGVDVTGSFQPPPPPPPTPPPDEERKP